MAQYILYTQRNGNCINLYQVFQRNRSPVTNTVNMLDFVQLESIMHTSTLPDNEDLSNNIKRHTLTG